MCAEGTSGSEKGCTNNEGAEAFGLRGRGGIGGERLAHLGEGLLDVERAAVQRLAEALDGHVPHPDALVRGLKFLYPACVCVYVVKKKKRCVRRAQTPRRRRSSFWRSGSVPGLVAPKGVPGVMLTGDENPEGDVKPESDIVQCVCVWAAKAWGAQVLHSLPLTSFVSKQKHFKFLDGFSFFPFFFSFP